MKLTKHRLKQIIKEELETVLNEAERKAGVASLNSIKQLDPNFKVHMDLDKVGAVDLFYVIEDISGPGISIHHPYGKYAKPDIRDKSKMIMGLAGESDEPETRRLCNVTIYEAQQYYSNYLKQKGLLNYVMSEALK
jgi:hypothetical protein